jgi:hypothetical protein
MRAKNTKRLMTVVGWSVALLFTLPVVAWQASAPSGQSKVVGTLKSLNGNSLTVQSDDGPQVTVTIQDGTLFLQVNPGEKDLKQAVPIRLQDLQTADRILVRGSGSLDNKAITASVVIIMKKIDLEARHQHEQQDWQKRGIGGLVSSADPATGDIAITVIAAGGKKQVVVQTTKQTIVRRYAGNSTKFDDAKPSTVAEIQPGDQLRARGTRNEDGTQFNAEEVVSGAFRNIAGTVSAIDSATATMTVADSITKKPVQVKVTSESQLRKLPVAMAQRIATRLKGGQPAAGTPGNTAGHRPDSPGTAGPNSQPSGQEGQATGSPAGDLQQMLGRLPASALGDFQKGDAVMIVSTEGSGDAVTAITVLGGVEPILSAAPAGGKDMVLSPWSLSAPEGGGGGGS